MNPEMIKKYWPEIQEGCKGKDTPSQGEQWATVRDCREKMACWNSILSSRGEPLLWIISSHGKLLEFSYGTREERRPENLLCFPIPLPACSWMTLCPEIQRSCGDSPREGHLPPPLWDHQTNQSGRRLIPYPPAMQRSQRLEGKRRKKGTAQGCHEAGISAWSEISKIQGQSRDDSRIYTYFSWFFFLDDITRN